MRLVVYVPLLLSAALALAGPPAARRMPPRTGTRLLLGAGVACATTSLFALALLASTLIGRLPLVAAVGGWSGDRLHHDDPVSPLTAKLAIAGLAVLAFPLAWTAAHRAYDVRRAHRACRRLGGHTGRLVVLDRPEPEAFAVPGRRGAGRIVVSTGMLRTLDAAERRVLLAHEAAHLDHRHHRHRALAALLAAANPLLATLPGAVHHLTERWADEEAATTAGDRKAAARTLARAALATHRARPEPPAGGAVLCFGRGDIGRRVGALLATAPRRRPLVAALLAAALACCLVSAAEAGRDTAQLFDRANDNYHARPVPAGGAAVHEARHLLSVLGRRL